MNKSGPTARSARSSGIGTEPAGAGTPPAPVPQADTYVAFPGAAFQPSRNHSYRALFDGTRGAENPGAMKMNRRRFGFGRDRTAMMCAAIIGS